MFGKRAKADAERMRQLRGEIAILHDRLAQLRGTRIRVSIPTDLGVKPLFDVDIESAIMLTNMMHGAEPAYRIEGMHVEVISQYSPLMVNDERTEDNADDI